jgi:hypothetical protein
MPRRPIRDIANRHESPGLQERREKVAFQNSRFNITSNWSVSGMSCTGGHRVSNGGTRLALRPVVTIAMPISQERISPLLDAAARLLLVTRRHGREVVRKELVLPPLPPAELARTVSELRVDVLLCAALSEVLRRELARHGVRVKAHLCGDIEAVLRAFCRDRLNRSEFQMPGCGRRLPAANCRRRAAHLVKTIFKPDKTK